MRSERALRRRFWIETALGSLTGILTVVTLISHEWIEIMFGVDPDRGSGALEWGIVLVLASATLLFGLLARAEWRHVVANHSE